MNISERIQSMYENVNDVYDTINNVDSPENKNIENIPDTIRKSYLDIMNNGYEKVWNNWDKVTGSGTEITLDNTEEAPMKLELKGNKSQDTTTGKNLCENKANNVVIATIPAGTYTFSLFSNIAGGYTLKNGSGSGSTISGTNYISVNTKSSATFTISEETSIFINGYSSTSGKTFGDDTIEWQLESGSSATDYEPYTGGIASPNPDYPQEVKVVKGDNNIKVEGKNLFDKNNANVLNAYINASGVVTISTLDRLIWLPIKPNADYTFQMTQKALPTSQYQDDMRIALFNSEPIIGTQGTIVYSATRPSATSDYYLEKTFNSGNNTYMAIKITQIQRSNPDETISTIQLEKGTQATSYEPYTSEEHTISLGVENLWKPIPSATKSGITCSYDSEEGCYILNGTSTGATSFYVSVSYPIGKYSLSANNDQIISGGADYLLLETSGGTSTNKTLALSLQNNSASFDVTSPITALVIVISSGKTYNNFKIYPMLEKGDKVHSFCKYGQEPIEMCNINNNKDTFIKGNNRNYFNPNSFSTFTSNVQYTLVTLKPNTKYTMSSNIPQCTGVGSNLFIMKQGEDASSSTNGISPSQPRTLTTDSTGIVKIGYRDGDNSLSDEKTKYWYMLNEGETALPYEPYQTTSWYKKEMTKKLDLSTITYWSKLTNGKFYLIDFANTYNYKNDEALSNLFAYSSTTWIDNCFGITQAGVLWIATTDTSIAGYDAFITWLGNKNAYMIGILSSPQYKLLPKTLQNQLNEIVKSYKSQTNISQENDGLPFEITASALESI